ncbi:MAG TPA: hypothetical protein VLE93_00100 [Candidatus Saccharimonadales bacterium]|nr:hypothetical protein [Candidatus Saccharimonadales bacterium]
MERRNGVAWGSARVDVNDRQWLIGDFIDSASPLHDNQAGLKYGSHLKGEHRSREEATADRTHRSLQIVISGRVKLVFPATDGTVHDQELIREAGDYTLWEPNTLYYWEILEDSVVLTFRWPAA